MTEKQKKLAIVVIIVVGIILLMFSRKGVTNTVIQKEGQLAPINVSIPGFNIPARSPIAINIPALPSFSPYNFNAISPCMCGGQQLYSSDSNSSGINLEFVTNQGNAGPNIYNYAAPTVSTPTTSNSSPWLYGNWNMEG